MTTFVIGSSSLLARVMQTHETTAGWTYYPHAKVLAEPDLLSEAVTVVNLAFNPRLKISPYSPSLDVDLSLAGILAARGVHYVMASTRMVYGQPQHDITLSEDMEPLPTTPYGMAKLETERRLAKLFGDRLTVLRLSNIFDPLEQDGGRRTFFGMALRNLKKSGCITFDMSPFVQRDFLPARILAERLAAIVAQPRAGTYNLGAGFAIPAGRIAQWLIEGYGSGVLAVTDFREFDAFRLDMDRSNHTWHFDRFTEADLREHCLTAGASLADSLTEQAVS